MQHIVFEKAILNFEENGQFDRFLTYFSESVLSDKFFFTMKNIYLKMFLKKTVYFRCNVPFSRKLHFKFGRKWSFLRKSLKI